MLKWCLLIAHFAADFYLQPPVLAEKKTEKYRFLLLHAVIYTVITAVAFFICIPAADIWIPCGIISAAHLLIDWTRIQFDKRHRDPLPLAASLILDQFLHIFIILLTAYSVSSRNGFTLWNPDCLQRLPLDVMARHILLTMIIITPASVVVKALSSCASNGSGNTGNERNSVGKLIGILERIIVAALVLTDEISTIGFVLAAKSLARFRQLENKEFAEKYLIGTLSSVAIALGTALVLR